MAESYADDVLTVVLCELGERLIALRDALAEPSIAAKPHARAVAALLAQGLDGIEARLQRDGLLHRAGDGGTALRAIAACSAALRIIHRRLGLLDLRWSAAPLDIFLRKLCDDVGDLPRPVVVLSDDYAALDHDVAERLRTGLAEAGVPLPLPLPMLAALTTPSSATGDPIIALPHLEAANPLSWPLLLLALARLALAAEDVAVSRDEGRGGVGDHLRAMAVARLGGPAAFAARAAHALLVTPPETALWPALAPLAGATSTCMGGLEERAAPERPFEDAGVVALFTRLLRTRDRTLGHAVPSDEARPLDEPCGGLTLTFPEPALPTAAETDVLLAKLVAGTPINAVEPPLPDDFVARLDGVRDAAAFYALIEPLGERPASLAAILGVGWLYKVRHGYPLFRDLLRAEGALGAALAAYRPHMIARNELLLQSIEAAHVQGIFNRGRLAE